MATAYNSGLLEIIDHLDPLCTKTVTLRPHAPWYTDELRDEKRRRRSAERLWLSSRLEVHIQMYRTQCVAYNRMLIATKDTYYSSKIADCGRDAKQLFNITKHLMGNEKMAKMPVHTCSSLMAQQFSDFFITKVNTIQKELTHYTHDATKVVMTQMSDDVKFRCVAMNCFEPVTESDVERLVSNALAKSCELEPIPTWLLKLCSCELLPIITNVSNASLVTSVVPAVFKCAIVKPVLKKSTLDSDALHNYGPVSNLSFVSKLVERVVEKQLNAHLDDNALRDPFQSAYRAGHSTETALIRVTNDIATALDRKCTTILVLLDLSCAFGTINHKILLRRLEHSVGISGAALEWLHSYVSERYHQVAVSSAKSSHCLLERGVPQGSVLGPLLYCVYTRPIGDIVTRHGLQYHCYADDTQIYVTVEKDVSIESALARIETCIIEVAGTINHKILLRRLEHSVGISGAALEWLHSYVSERYHQVAVSSAKSSHCLLERGVPQGSVLGPLLYCVYTRPIGDIVTRHGLQYHCYADDTQIYVTVEKDVSIESALARIETCIIEVAAWMAKNDLNLNAKKSQAIIFQPSKHRVNKQPEVCVEIAGHRISLSTSVRNLGVVFDSRLSMEEQVAQTAKLCYYQLRNIGQIRSSITEGACRTLVHALITSRLDYGNGLLYGIPQVTIQRLQRIQNCAARIVTRTRKYEHITPVLRLLHWLPVRQRTLFKVLVFTYCALNATAPNYLVQLINHRNVARTLRSSTSTELLFVPKSRTMMYDDRCFEVASPILWNNLPV